MPSLDNSMDKYLELLLPLQRQLEVYCRRALRDPSFVEDLLQTVVARTIADFAHFEEGTNFRAWIFRYLSLEVLAFNRRESAKDSSSAVDDLEQVASWEQLVGEQLFDSLLNGGEEILDQCDDVIATAVRQLSETERAVFLLRAVGELKYAEIAETLNVPIGTVMSHLSRSRAALRCRLQEHANERGYFRSQKTRQDHRAENDSNLCRGDEP